MGENEKTFEDSPANESDQNAQSVETEEVNAEVEVMPPEAEETSSEKKEEAKEGEKPSEGSVVELLKEELNKAKEENAALNDKFTRAIADFQNLKRRTAVEYASLKRESVKNFVLKMLNPLDNLERVIVPNPSDEVKPFVDGVKMIINEFIGVLEKEGISKIDASGKPFDPSQMEAIASEESEDYNEEIVIEVFRSGYEFSENNERFPLRPALVKVGKPIL
ncbi:MAG: nucleotide exchange factor GrpE [Leptospiraceae bacterium]|nr:nucleotide exchange factor GrpE [Leptospiraceae bacterium]